ncbi:shikimate dehydrogenase [Alteribacillus iranensis]|uniref:Shikimate dehydrogenase (NADP(+)) n=1 Tax=Alteribacillus iranensis TaxID=930128 RepID=A0A1I1ZDA1_9BACI|nr:shikimate dehydrogenase [Alteribacillus iranensis]SFE28300.1 shikimate dehydrogenase [Alteribacillus iranensis]
MWTKKAEKLFGLIGYPTGHSMSPTMHNEQFRVKELPYYYHAFNVHPDHLKEAVDGMKALGVSGFNVTVPHKVAVMDYLDKIDEEAEIIGAVNTVVNENGQWVGYNTDGRGYVDSLKRVIGDQLKESDILVVGAGGASRAVVTALALYGVASITITNRTVAKAEEIRRMLPENYHINVLNKTDAESQTSTYDVIVNTTSVGMYPHVNETPWVSEGLKRGCLCSDLIYNPLQTRWLEEAAANGANTINGVGMFVGQGALAFQKWTGIEPDTDRMTEVVVEELGGKKSDAYR